MKNLKISNIPIYRAKKIDSNEYVIGYYQTETGTNVEDKNNMFRTLRHIIIDLDKYQLRLDLFGDKKLHDDSHIREQYEIDPTTLAIHFPSMVDSNGNKIFASLQEDGKGGDILYYKSKIGLVTKTTVYFENYRLITHSKGENTFRDKESLSKFEIIGIKE